MQTKTGSKKPVTLYSLQWFYFRHSGFYPLYPPIERWNTNLGNVIEWILKRNQRPKTSNWLLYFATKCRKAQQAYAKFIWGAPRGQLFLLLWWEPHEKLPKEYETISSLLYLTLIAAFSSSSLQLSTVEQTGVCNFAINRKRKED